MVEKRTGMEKTLNKSFCVDCFLFQLQNGELSIRGTSSWFNFPTSSKPAFDAAFEYRKWSWETAFVCVAHAEISHKVAATINLFANVRPVMRLCIFPNLSAKICKFLSAFISENDSRNVLLEIDSKKIMIDIGKTIEKCCNESVEINLDTTRNSSKKFKLSLKRS